MKRLVAGLVAVCFALSLMGCPSATPKAEPKPEATPAAPEAKACEKCGKTPCECKKEEPAAPATPAPEAPAPAAPAGS